MNILCKMFGHKKQTKPVQKETFMYIFNPLDNSSTSFATSAEITIFKNSKPITFTVNTCKRCGNPFITSLRKALIG